MIEVYTHAFEHLCSEGYRIRKFTVRAHVWIFSCEPGVSPDVVEGEAGFNVHLHHSPEKRKCFGREVLPEFVIWTTIGAYVFVELVATLAWLVPRSIADQEDEQYNTA